MSSGDPNKRIATSSGQAMSGPAIMVNDSPNKVVAILKEAIHILKTKGTPHQGWLKNEDLVEVKLIIEKAIKEIQQLVPPNPGDHNKPIATYSASSPVIASSRKRKLSLDEDSDGNVSPNTIVIILQKAVSILNAKQTSGGWLSNANRIKMMSMFEEAIYGLQKLPIELDLMSASTSQPKEAPDKEDTIFNYSPKVVKILQKAMRILHTDGLMNNIENFKSMIGDALEELQKPPKNFNEMTDDCLLLVFEKFPLQTMLSKFRGVCHRWRDVIDGQICERKRTLMIFGKVTIVKDYGRQVSRYNLADKEHITLQPIGRDNDLILPLFGQKRVNSNALGLCDLLVRLFPNVENLVLGIYLSTNAQVNLFRLLLSKWTKLNSLTLAFPSTSSTQFLASKQDELPQLNLKSLNIIHSEMYNSTPQFHFISPNLSHLSFIFVGDYDKLEPLLAQFPPNLRSLHLQTISSKNDSLGSYLKQLKPKLTDNAITSLTFTRIKKFKAVSRICRLFPSVVELHLGFANGAEIKFTSDLISHLSSLPELTTLTLDSITADLSVSKVSTKFSLPTVKNLTFNELNFYGEYYAKILFSTMLTIFFPNLEQLTAKWQYKISSYLKKEYLDHTSQFPRCFTISTNYENSKLYLGRHGGELKK